MPKLSSYFSHTLYALLESEAFEPSDLVWVVPSASGNEEEDDLVFVEEYFKTIAEFLILWYEKKANRSWKETVRYFTKTGLRDTFKNMHPKILEDNLFADIEDKLIANYNPDYAKVLIPLLDQDPDDSKGNQAKLDAALKSA